MNINIEKLKSVVVKDHDGSEMCRIYPESVHMHKVSGNQYLTLVNSKPNTPVTHILTDSDEDTVRLQNSGSDTSPTKLAIVSEDLLRDFIGLRNNVSWLKGIKGRLLVLDKIVESCEVEGVISVTFNLKENDIVLDTVNSTKTLTDLDYFKDNYENLLDNCTKHAVYSMFLLLHSKLFT